MQPAVVWGLAASIGKPLYLLRFWELYGKYDKMGAAQIAIVIILKHH